MGRACQAATQAVLARDGCTISSGPCRSVTAVHTPGSGVAYSYWQALFPRHWQASGGLLSAPDSVSTLPLSGMARSPA
jgi:hypothetical protein